MRFSFVRVVVAAGLILAALHVSARPAWAEYGTVTLEWTAPGDDSLIGTAKAYDLRYLTIPITPLSFGNSTAVSPLPVPLQAGKLQSVTVHGLTPGRIYYFAMRTVDHAGNWSALSNVVGVIASYPLAVGDETLPLDFSTPFPNPARGTASFTLTAPVASEATIEAFDVGGRVVRTLFTGTHPAGRTTLVWDLRDDAGRPLPSGLYLVRARLGGRTFVRRVSVDR